MTQSLLEIYAKLHKGEISVSEAATQFGLSEKGLKIRLTKHGDRIRLVLAALDKIKEDEISRGQVAEALSIDCRQVNALMHSWNVARPASIRLVEREASRIKWDIRQAYAVSFVRGTFSISDAALHSKVSERQMRRWVIDLLADAKQVRYKELKKLDLLSRKDCATAILKALGKTELELDAALALDASRRGIHEKAIEKVEKSNKLHRFQKLQVGDA